MKRGDADSVSSIKKGWRWGRQPYSFHDLSNF